MPNRNDTMKKLDNLIYIVDKNEDMFNRYLKGKERPQDI